MRPKVAVIGAGRVGTAFTLRLKEKGYPVVAVASRSPASAGRLAEMTGAKACGAAEAARAGELVLLTTPDGVIAVVAEEISREGGFCPGQFVAHASGALPAAVLSPARQAGAAVFSLHPLQSFATPELAVDRLPGSYFTFEGDADALPLARRLVADLDGILFELDAAAKPLYHAAACVASNYLVTLLGLVLTLAERAGLPRDGIFPAFLPLIQGTLQNVGAVGPVTGLTGPVARGDVETIRQHARAMEKDAWELYRMLGLHTVKLARRKGLSPETARELEKIFGEVK
ncbi:MAG: Rossmann-like and DUF2520 domain-containing protein [Bacillota bacterium]